MRLATVGTVSHTDFYRAVLRALKLAGVEFLIGGTYALARHTGIDRRTKDLDLMIRRRDWSAAARALRTRGIYTRLSFPHWLAKVLSGRSQVDIIFSGGNGLTRVDDVWFERGVPARVLGFNVLLSAPEELLWSKAFVMERERFDGADVLHLILARAETLDWEHLCDRFRGHEGVLLAYLILFGYVYPGEAARVPFWMIPRLFEASDPPRPRTGRLCRGTLLSRAQYLIDVERWGFSDARRPPFGSMTDREYTIWTNAIAQHWSRRRLGRSRRLSKAG
ncbi:MAG TPA: hypothetical protein VES67_21660 [Vicinamibacterales bacterium]|nr:hypothetical protein [Vicinamibacterales bacterium]